MGSFFVSDFAMFLLFLPPILTPSTLLLLLFTLLTTLLLSWFLLPAGPAWPPSLLRRGPVPIPGSRGLPLLGSLLLLSGSRPHRQLRRLALLHSASDLMAFSVGATPAVVSSSPSTARELLAHPFLANRPLKQSARELMFARAIGFAPNGEYWRLLRRIAASHLFSPRRLAAHEPGRQTDFSAMAKTIEAEQAVSGAVCLRPHLQATALNNIMGSVFGFRYDISLARTDPAVQNLKSMVREGFEILGAFNWSDHLPWLAAIFDPSDVKQRCAALVPRVRSFVKSIIDEHKSHRKQQIRDNADFVDVLLSFEGEEKLHEDDMIAILWEMIFRGTDTTALLTEWAMAELVLHPESQSRLREEIDDVVGIDGDGEKKMVTDADVARMPYLQAVVKESLRAHPPGPLLSWARLASDDVQLGNGMVVPAGTTVMVNMWAIAHDPAVWARPEEFRPERFLESAGGTDVDVRGCDLRLAPFGAGRRVCPGKHLAIVTVGSWLANLVRAFEWGPSPGADVDLEEVLKLSCEMKTPLTAVARPRFHVIGL